MKKTLFIALFALLGKTQTVAQENEYLPLVRDGVKWVNEKVIVNNGDTTNYYYTYEIAGPSEMGAYDEWGWFNYRACHYYEGHRIGENNDSIICELTNYPDIESVNDCVLCQHNKALEKVKENQGLLLGYPEMDKDNPSDWFRGAILLYNFSHNRGGIGSWYPFGRWEYSAYYGVEFEEVDSIQIEGYNCSRYAYIQDGDTLAYVVEGVGFDSRDMGDLLTPFTRRPDPTADYQEWCGLCHVVKDGKVIYKGMRYNPNNRTGIDEVVEDKVSRPLDPRYYDLMGRAVGTEVPTTPGIYIHQGKKICVSQMP